MRTEVVFPSAATAGWASRASIGSQVKKWAPSAGTSLPAQGRRRGRCRSRPSPVGDWLADRPLALSRGVLACTDLVAARRLRTEDDHKPARPSGTPALRGGACVEGGKPRTEVELASWTLAANGDDASLEGGTAGGPRDGPTLALPIKGDGKPGRRRAQKPGRRQVDFACYRSAPAAADLVVVVLRSSYRRRPGTRVVVEVFDFSWSTLRRPSERLVSVADGRNSRLRREAASRPANTSGPRGPWSVQ